MLKKIIVVSLFTLGLSLANLGNAANLKQNMRALNSSYKAFVKAKNSADATQALQNMQQAIESSKSQRPKKLAKLAEDDAQVLAYTASLDALLNQVHHAQHLLADNQLEQAHAVLDSIDDIKSQGHKQFK